jgi:hypothetical protein
LATLFVTGIYTRAAGLKRTYTFSASYHLDHENIVWRATVRLLDGGVVKGELSGSVDASGVAESDWQHDVRRAILERIAALAGVKE